MSQPHFPKMLSSQIAFDIARTILDGFDKHYRLFREISQAAAALFARGEWQTLQHNARDRIQFYEKRVRECVQILEDEYDPADLTDQVFQCRLW